MSKDEKKYSFPARFSKKEEAMIKELMSMGKWVSKNHLIKESLREKYERERKNT